MIVNLRAACSRCRGIYMTRRRWDYFVRHLLGAAAPHAYAFQRPGVPGGDD